MFLINRLPKFIKRLLCKTPRVKKISFAASFKGGLIVKGEFMSMILRIDQQVTLAPSFLDAAGNTVTDLGGAPVWSVSDPLIADVTPSADGLSAVVSSTGVLGKVQVNMTVDADPDADVEEIVGTVELEFKAGKAVFVVLNGTVADAGITGTIEAVDSTPVGTTIDTVEGTTPGTSTETGGVTTSSTDAETAA